MKGFTLIELLVVITIIVVLLALLTPALDDALYQADLALCGAKLDAVVTGGTHYAFDRKRVYPRRPKPIDGWQPDFIRGFFNGEVVDMRPEFEGYLSLNTMTCPLTGEIDLSYDANPSHDVSVYASYEIWFGWQYTGQAGMTRLGDRFSAAFQGETRRFNIVASDLNLVKMLAQHTVVVQNEASHPDEDGAMFNHVIQEDAYAGSNTELAGMMIGTAHWTLSRWESPSQGIIRGLSDFNHGYADGSVSRINDVEAHDERMFRAPAHMNPAAAGQWKIELPR